MAGGPLPGRRARAARRDRPALAVVEVDGGRLQIRGEGQGPGAHQAAWHEDKIAILATMAPVISECDPEPELPACFRDRAYVEKVIGAIGGTGPMGPPAPEIREPAVLPIPAVAEAAEPGARRSYRCTPTWPRPPRSIASGRWSPPRPDGGTRRGRRPGVLGGRLGLDLGAAPPLFPDLRGDGQLPPRPGPPLHGGPGHGRRHRGPLGVIQAWAEACWNGRVDRVIADFAPGVIPRSPCAGLEGLADNIPEDRREGAGLPGRQPGADGLSALWSRGPTVDNSHVESTVKVLNRRVKGSEKLWGRGRCGAISHSVRPSFPKMAAWTAT